MGRGSDASVATVWRDRVRRQRGSGLSVAEFCRRNELSVASFYHWRKRVEKSESADSAPPQFVPVEMPASWNATSEICMELPGGAVVRFPGNTSVELLAAAIEAARYDAARQRGLDGGGERC